MLPCTAQHRDAVSMTMRPRVICVHICMLRVMASAAARRLLLRVRGGRGSQETTYYILHSTSYYICIRCVLKPNGMDLGQMTRATSIKEWMLYGNVLHAKCVYYRCLA